jgi:hypothetical protein
LKKVIAAGVVEPLASINCELLQTLEPAKRMDCSRSRDGGFFGSRYCRMKRLRLMMGTTGATHLK